MKTPPLLDFEDPQGDVLSVFDDLRLAIARHPIAAKAIVKALHAEGMRFRATPDGEELARRLHGTQVAARADALWQLATVNALDPRAPETMPVAVVDAIAALLAAGRPEVLLATRGDHERP